MLACTRLSVVHNINPAWYKATQPQEPRLDTLVDELSVPFLTDSHNLSRCQQILKSTASPKYVAGSRNTKILLYGIYSLGKPFLTQYLLE